MWRRAARWTINVVAVVCVVVLMLLGLGPRLFGYRTLTVLTGSMRPGMPPGSLVVVTREPLASVRLGQVITYQVPVGDREVVTHRVVERYGPADQPTVRTKGDANPVADPWMAQLHGQAWRARFAVPHAGSLLLLLRHRIARIVLVDFLPLLVAGAWIVDVWRGGNASDDSASANENSADDDSGHEDDADAPLILHLDAHRVWSEEREQAVTVALAAATIDAGPGTVFSVVEEGDGSTFVVVLVGTATIVNRDGAVVTVPAAHAAHLLPTGAVHEVVHATAAELLGDRWISDHLSDRDAMVAIAAAQPTKSPAHAH